jgi:hypothetical protein
MKSFRRRPSRRSRAAYAVACTGWSRFFFYREHGETGESKSGQDAHRLPVRSLLSELTDLPVKSAFTVFPSFCRKMVMRFSHRRP